MFYKVREYENYIEYYPNTTQVKLSVKAGEVFEMDSELVDKNQLGKLEVVGESAPVIVSEKKETENQEDIFEESKTVDPISKESAREKLRGNK